MKHLLQACAVFVIVACVSQAWALSINGTVKLHDGIAEHAGFFTFDNSSLPGVIEPWTSFSLRVDTFSLNFLGQFWNETNTNVFLQYTGNEITGEPDYPHLYGTGYSNGRELELYAGDLPNAFGPASREHWVAMVPGEMNIRHGLVDSQVGTVANPEPATWVLFGTGLLGLWWMRRRRVEKVMKEIGESHV